MRWSRLAFISLLSFLFVAGGAIFKKSIALLLCGVFALNTLTCSAWIDGGSRAIAAVHSDSSEVSADMRSETSESQLIGDIPLIRVAPVDLQNVLPTDFVATLQLPSRDGRREVVMTSPSTGMEQRFLINMPRTGGLQIFGIEFKNISSVDVSRVLRETSQLTPEQAQELLRNFKVSFNGNILSEVVLSDGSRAEFSSGQAVIKQPDGQILETLQLPTTNLNVPSLPIAQATKSFLKLNHNSPHTNEIKLAQASSCEETASKAATETKTLVATWEEELSKSLNSRTRVVRWALAFTKEAISQSTLPGEESLQNIACRLPVRCGERRIAGSSEVRTDIFEVPPGAGEGDISITYEFFTIPDRLEMFYENESPFFTVGPASGQGSTSVTAPPDGAEYVGVTIRGNPDPNTRWWYELSCSYTIEPPQITALDRWWAEKGQPLDEITLTIEVPRGKYELNIDRGTFSHHWDLNNATVTISDKTVPLGRRQGVADLGLLEQGRHELKIRGFQAPSDPFVEEIKFILSNLDTEQKDDFIAFFVADHNEEARQYYSVKGSSEALRGKSGLVNYFAPILYFHEDDAVQFPQNAEAAFNSSQKRSHQENKSFRQGDSKTFLVNPPQAGEERVYASVLENDAKELAINYYFFYPTSDWANHGGYNNHEGDWEGITLFLESENEEWALSRAAYANHTFSKSYSLGELEIETDAGQHPRVYVGLGGHASYPISDETRHTTLDTIDPSVEGYGQIENHSGQNRWSSQGYVEYLPHIGRLGVSNANYWLVYPGNWGNPDLDGDGSRTDGDGAPNGPVFLEVSLNKSADDDRGIRWLDPWAWESSQ